ncbi:MAG TPA: efflux RND transporter periplasmic adaptor subunit [Thermoanaerobaculia bacterium]|nr:efflux RND transporter periplasmic adaptor subunit [Thermoanaerobaculia bacterium]
MKRVLALILLTVACSKKPATTTTNTTAEAPALPADVASVTATTETTDTTTKSGVAAVAEATAGDAIVATGEFIAPVRSELAVKMPGRVARMYVEEGSRVAKGQPVLDLETDYLRINLQRANADVARAKAAEADAGRDLERKKELIAKDSIPRATFDRSQANYDQASAARQSAEAQSALLRQQLSDATLRSPINGVVAEKRTDVGQRLGDATVALVIVQTSPLKLRFRVPERYIATIKKGDSVKARVDPYPDQVFAGRVTTIGGVIDPATRSLAVETEFANQDGKLKPGLFARVEMAVR